MNGPTDHSDDFGSWDDLAAELGLESTPKPKAPMAAAAPAAVPVPVAAKHEVSPAPEPEPEEFGAFVEAEFDEPVKIEKKPAPSHLRSVEPDDEPPDVLGDEALADEVTEAGDEATIADEGAAEESAEGPAGGRRRRRRRRKKGGAKPDLATGSVEPAPISAPAAIVAIEENLPEFENVEIVGEAAAELEDDEEEPSPALVAEELDEDSTEPLPEWKVVAWTDLIATLYRPQDRA